MKHKWKIKPLENMNIKLYTCQRCRLNVTGKSIEEVNKDWQFCSVKKEKEMKFRPSSQMSVRCMVTEDIKEAADFSEQKYTVWTVCKENGDGESLKLHFSKTRAVSWIIFEKKPIAESNFYLA